MKKVLQKIERTLKDYKEIIDFISKIILTIASIIIAVNANKIATRQMMIDELQITPYIMIERNVDNEKIEIKNNGNPIYNVEIKFETLLEIMTIDRETVEIKTTKIPVDNFYLFAYETGMSENLIATIIPNSIYRDYEKIEEDLINKISEINKNSIITLTTYIDISYTDQLNRKYNEYFETQKNQSKKIDKNEMDNILESYFNDKEKIELKADYYDYILSLIENN